MKNLPDLEGKLVKMGCFTHEHVKQYHTWLQDEYILKMTETDRGMSLKEVSKIRDEIEEADDMAHYLIFDKKTNKPVGDADLRDIKPGKKAECAVMIGEGSYREKGYATEALDLLLNYGFKNFGLKKVTAPILYFNKPSIALHKKLGFQEKRRKGKDILFELKRS
jgi:RimJ/RimL family protein N-acetyltransferase